MADPIEGVELLVGGFRYPGFKSIRVTESIEGIAGSFALELNDKWDGDEAPWTVLEEDPCQVLLDGEVVIDGYIDSRDPSGNATERSLSYSGRDRAAALVDCSALLTKWTYNNVTLADFATTLTQPYGIRVSVQTGLTLSKIARISVSPGDKVHEVLKRLAVDQGVLLVSDGAGGVLITRTGIERAEPLIEGGNVIAAAGKFDAIDRFYRYVVMTQPASTDDAAGEATRVMADAFDEGVRRKERVLLIQPERGHSVADAKLRAQWEAKTRAAKAESVTVTVQGWKQSNGRRWRVNTHSKVVVPRLAGVEGDMLITQVERGYSQAGRITQLSLVRPDAFTPEPKVRAPLGAAGDSRGWPELRKGAR